MCDIFDTRGAEVNTKCTAILDFRFVWNWKCDSTCAYVSQGNFLKNIIWTILILLWLISIAVVNLWANFPKELFPFLYCLFSTF